MNKLFFLAFFISTLAFAKNYEVDGTKFTVETLFTGSDVIWGFEFLDSKSADEMVFTERDGKFRYLNLKNKKSHEISGVPKVYAQSQGGLLDVYKDPQSNNLFLTYAEPVKDGATTSLFKGQLSADKTKLEGKRIFQAQAVAKTGEHFGSRIAIDKEGFLFVSIGERNQRDRSQQLNNHQGKVLRLDNEGRAVKDNPFVTTKDALPEIWSYGHRNPQGLIIDPSGAILNAEMGPRGGDEVNLVQRGGNYGWPIATYGKEYWGPKIAPGEKTGTIQPLYYWAPSISPSGMMIYSGTAFKNYSGNIFLATLSGSHLHRVVVDKNRKLIKEENLLSDLEERFRQVKMGPDGFIYLSTDSGKILRMKPL